MFFAISALGALWDSFTTFLGLLSIFKNSWAGLFMSLVITLIVQFFVLSGSRIRSGQMNELKLPYYIAIFFDFYTSFVGNSAFLIGVTDAKSLFDNLISFKWSIIASIDIPQMIVFLLTSILTVYCSYYFGSILTRKVS